MKKAILMILAAACATALFGCAANSDVAMTKQQEAAQPENTYTGRVFRLVGNEMELELGSTKQEEGGMTADGSAGEESVEFATEDAALYAGEAGESGGDFDFFGENRSAPELVYSGEKKSLVIPAGAEILDATGQKAMLSSVKKGSVLMIGTSGTGEHETVVSVAVMG